MIKSTIKPVAYLPPTAVFAELSRMATDVATVGVLPDDTTVGGSFDEWSTNLQEGQTAWIYTLDRFRSITELMGYYEAMRARGVTIRSVKELWFNDPQVSGSEVLGHLFRLGEDIHHRVLPLALTIARRSEDSSFGLPVQTVIKVKKAVELRVTRNMSVVAACRLAGCGVSAYYRYLKEQQRII